MSGWCLAVGGRSAPPSGPLWTLSFLLMVYNDPCIMSFCLIYFLSFVILVFTVLGSMLLDERIRAHFYRNMVKHC